MPVSTRTRFNVFKRDSFTCLYCGRTPPSVILHCDHVIPESKGGSSQIGNLVTACADCNLGKSNIELTTSAPSLQFDIVEARERANQLKKYNDFLKKQRTLEDESIKRIGLYYCDFIPGCSGHTLGTGRTPSIRNFIKRLPEETIKEAIDIAMRKVIHATKENDFGRWKYFCAVCWTKIREGESPK